MPLDAYPFSQRYGWTEDRYGLLWQLMQAGDHEIGQRIAPTLMFVGEVCGKAEEAVGFYTSVFRDSLVGDILRYGPGEAPDVEGMIKHVSFVLAGQRFGAIDSALDHDLGFNEAISLLVSCDTQERSTAAGRPCRRFPKPKRAAGRRTGTACRGRSCPRRWTTCSARAPRNSARGSPRHSSR
jgi:predicted 3-demethylubiquinone-9 3-methyltransferase (glyoxalase superfamily)